MPSSPSYLYRNHCGTFCFQRRIPKGFSQVIKTLPPLFRLSLSTTNRKAATQKARRLAVMFDELAQQYFDDPEGFAAAIKLLQQYNEARQIYTTFEAFQTEFLDRLDDVTGRDSRLLNKAIAYANARDLAVAGQPRQHQKSQVGLSSEVIGEMLNAKLGEAFQNQHKINLISISLSDAFERFIEANRRKWSSDGDSELKYRQDTFPLFAELVGNVMTIDLTTAHSNLYLDAVMRMPANRRKKAEYREKNIQELMGLDIPIEHRLNSVTVGKYLDRLKLFLIWLEDNKYAPAGLYVPFKYAVKGEKRNPNEDRAQYSAEDLRKLFNSKQYIKGEHDQSFKYWVPLLLLFSGARVNEICQLHLSDIYEDQDAKIWVLDINVNESEITKKSLKNVYSRRLIPIHSELRKLGFIDYVEQLKKSGEIRLFPELRYHPIKNKYGNTALRWFNNTYTNARNCGVQTPKTSLHSLRHTVRNNWRDIGQLTAEDIDPVMGHVPIGSEGSKRYLKTLAIQKKSQIIEKLNYKHCINFSLIKHWKKQRFGLVRRKIAK